MIKSVKMFLAKTGEWAIKNEPTILTVVGEAGIVSTSIFAWRGGAKASKELERLKYESKDIPTFKEKVKVVAPIALPVVIMGGTSMACFAAAHNTLSKRNLALATAYTISESKFKDYKNKVEDTIGKNKAEKIKEEIVKDKLEKNPPVDENILWTGHGEQLCYDALFGRYFRSDAEHIRKCVNDINEMLLRYNYVCLNDFYERLGLSPIKIGYDLGWNLQNGLLEISPSSELTSTNEACYVIDYDIVPEFHFDEYA